MTTKRIWIPIAMSFALLTSVACKKQETTTPEDVATSDVDEADEADEADVPDDSEPEVTMLTKASFDETINDHMQEVSDCYVALLEANPELAGKLDAEFTFDEAGVPTSVVAAEGSTLTDEGLVQCIAEAAKSWSFGTPKEAGMKMRYQYNLAPAG